MVKVKHNNRYPIIVRVFFLSILYVYNIFHFFFPFCFEYSVLHLYSVLLQRAHGVHGVIYIQTNKLFFASLSLCCKHHYPINAFSRVLVKSIILTRLLKPQDVSPKCSGIKKQKCIFYLSLAKKTICPLRWD